MKIKAAVLDAMGAAHPYATSRPLRIEEVELDPPGPDEVLIIQDDAYGMIRWKQAVDSFTDFGLTFGNPDFVKYAEAYGAKGRRVESAEGLAPALEAAFQEGGVQLVTVPVDYSENERVLVDELRNRAKKEKA